MHEQVKNIKQNVFNAIPLTNIHLKAMYDWITTVCCTIAVLTGLTTTIFLLAIYQKALPALPISIAFGMLYYFVAKTVLVPYVAALCVFGMVGL